MDNLRICVTDGKIQVQAPDSGPIISIMNALIARRIGQFALLLASISALGGCAVYEPAPAYYYGDGGPVYAEPPAYYGPPPVYVAPPSLFFGFRSGGWGHRGYRGHGGYRHHDWD